MSIIYSAKQVSPEVQDAIAKFLATNKVTTKAKRAKPGAKKAEEARKAFLEKRKLEHMKLVDQRG